jgi:hypothetical protein
VRTRTPPGMRRDARAGRTRRMRRRARSDAPRVLAAASRGPPAQAPVAARGAARVPRSARRARFGLSARDSCGWVNDTWRRSGGGRLPVKEAWDGVGRARAAAGRASHLAPVSSSSAFKRRGNLRGVTRTRNSSRDASRGGRGRDAAARDLSFTRRGTDRA